jgi:hypothetical protein
VIDRWPFIEAPPFIGGGEERHSMQRMPMSNIRNAGLNWLRMNLRTDIPDSHICVSKCYDPSESWTGEKAWWFDVPIKKCEDVGQIGLLCQQEPGSERFYFLAVPKDFFGNPQFRWSIYRDAYRLWLSAEDYNKFREVHNRNQNLNFSEFQEI